MYNANCMLVFINNDIQSFRIPSPPPQKKNNTQTRQKRKRKKELINRNVPWELRRSTKEQVVEVQCRQLTPCLWHGTYDLGEYLYSLSPTVGAAIFLPIFKSKYLIPILSYFQNLSHQDIYIYMCARSRANSIIY